MKLSTLTKKLLTWDDLATAYDREGPGGRRARTLPMATVAGWAESRKDLFTVTKDGGFVRKARKAKAN